MDLNPVIHQPIRTRVFAVLASREEITFTALKKELGTTDGNLTIHMKKIENAGYIEMRKEFISNKPRTTYSMTDKGREAFRQYLDQLTKLLHGNGG